LAEPFKNLLGPRVIADIGEHLQRVWPGFDRPRFQALSIDGLESLEMKARTQHLCNALELTLPTDFNAAADVMEASLATMDAVDDTQVDGPIGAGDDGLSGWSVWPLTEYVARHGHAHTPRSMALLHAMTQRFTGEWAIRPFILREPKLVFETLHTWLRDPSAHVRRLVSEGSRPRLPWGLVLKPLVADPSPTLPLLEVLMDDPSPYVRRSVANHLNDIAKDHPHLVESWLRRHLPGAPQQRLALLRHASRTLVKRGHAGVMDALGVGTKFDGTASLVLSSDEATVGEVLGLHLTLRSASEVPQRLAVDYAVHHVKARGDASAKVFKGWSFELAPNEMRELTKRHSLKPVTTRRYFAGTHRIEVLINGQPAAQASFQLLTREPDG
jgi:3-methyladenine DNA glycosylase AlkC